MASVLKEVDWPLVARMLVSGNMPDGSRVDGLVLHIAPGNATVYTFQFAGGSAWANEWGGECMFGGSALMPDPAPSCAVMMRVSVGFREVLNEDVDLFGRNFYRPETLRLRHDRKGRTWPISSVEATLVAYVVNKLREAVGSWKSPWRYGENVDEAFARAWAREVSDWADAPPEMLATGGAR